MKHYTCPGWKCPACGAVVALTEKDEAPHYCYKCPSCGMITGADEWDMGMSERLKGDNKK